MPLPSILDAAHCAADAVLSPGAVAVDATVGNGHDTVFLAQAVGEEGRVYGFDVQTEALQSTRERVEAAGFGERLTLVEGGHENLLTHLPDRESGALAVVMFNLGYLPGSDSDVVTHPETTCAALDAAAKGLRPGGRITAVMYTGHEGGHREAAAVDRWAGGLSSDRFTAVSYAYANRPNDPPRLLVVEKHGSE